MPDILLGYGYEPGGYNSPKLDIHPASSPGASSCPVDVSGPVLVWVDADSFRPTGAVVENQLRACGYRKLFKFKRGEKIRKWIDNNFRPEELENEFVLVTNWKEAKSCVGALEPGGSLFGCLTLFVIVCDNGLRSFDLAGTWLETLPSYVRADRVLLCRFWHDAIDSLIIWKNRDIDPFSDQQLKRSVVTF
jgi:hypothetical protein